MRRSRLNGIMTSCVVHGVVFATAVFLTTSRNPTRVGSSPAAYEPPSHIIWLSSPGPGGGGGGGGRKEQSPARSAAVQGSDTQTMPAAPRAGLMSLVGSDTVAGVLVRLGFRLTAREGYLETHIEVAPAKLCVHDSWSDLIVQAITSVACLPQ